MQSKVLEKYPLDSFNAFQELALQKRIESWSGALHRARKRFIEAHPDQTLQEFLKIKEIFEQTRSLEIEYPKMLSNAERVNGRVLMHEDNLARRSNPRNLLRKAKDPEKAQDKRKTVRQENRSGQEEDELAQYQSEVHELSTVLAKLSLLNQQILKNRELIASQIGGLSPENIRKMLESSLG